MFTRKKITCQDNACNVKYSSESGLKHVIHREKSVVDEFYMEKSIDNDGNEVVSFTDPLIILFNQERLNSMGATAAKAYLDSLVPHNDALAELRQKCSDEDLLCMIKSKHLQSPSEILSWSRYMQENVDKFNAEVKKIIEAQQKPLDITEPPKTE